MCWKVRWGQIENMDSEMSQRIRELLVDKKHQQCEVSWVQNDSMDIKIILVQSCFVTEWVGTNVHNCVFPQRLRWVQSYIQWQKSGSKDSIGWSLVLQASILPFNHQDTGNRLVFKLILTHSSVIFLERWTRSKSVFIWTKLPYILKIYVISVSTTSKTDI